MALFSESTLLKVGAKAPDFTLPDQNGESVHLYELLKDKWVVLFFYPKDHSPGCTTQVCAFRNAYAEFRYAGAEVIGISSDSVESHERFARATEAPFRLLADTDGKIRESYGVPMSFGLIPGRVTFVLDHHGTVQMVYPSLFNAKAHMTKALAIMKKHRMIHPG